MKAGVQDCAENLDDVREVRNNNSRKGTFVGSFLSRFYPVPYGCIIISMALWLSLDMAYDSPELKQERLFSTETPNVAEPEMAIKKRITKLQEELDD